MSTLSASDIFAAGIKAELARDYGTAFTSYVAAAQAFLALARGAAEAQTREKAKTNAAKAMQRAEKVKGKREVGRQTWSLDQVEQSRTLAASSLINGAHYAPWEAPDCSRVRAAPPPPLSSQQASLGAKYAQPRSSNGGNVCIANGKQPLRGVDICQDVVTDCSVVAALEAAAEHDARWGTKLACSSLYPKDAEGLPCSSSTGVHLVRLRINGVDRSVSITPDVPCYPDGLPMCARGITQTGIQLWPSLIEKAYLQLQGGYDFSGSNSAADLHALTGWVPEQVGLSHAGFQREKTWDRLWPAWKEGRVIITAGTGSKPRGTGVHPLVSSHDYAVLELREVEGRRSLVCLNPWAGKNTSSPEDDQAPLPRHMSSNAAPRTFTMSWTEACNRLDSLYLNWDPALLSQSLAVHFTLRPHAEAGIPLSVGQNPQFRLELGAVGVGEGEEVWLHLARHLRKDVERREGEVKEEEREFVALHVFEHEEGRRLYQQRVDGKLGTYIDGTHDLVRLRATSRSYTLVVSRHGPPIDASFTLTAYASVPLSLHELPRAYAYEQKLSGTWRGRTAGGNVTYPTFLHNPQFQVVVPANPGSAERTTGVLFLLEASKDLPVQVLLLWSSKEGGKRTSHCAEADVAASSGAFSYGLAVAEAALHPGTYTLVVATFEPRQEGAFALTAQCAAPGLRVEAIPAEGAGMYRRTLRGAYGGACTFDLTVEKPTARLIARLHSAVAGNGPRPYARLALLKDGKEVASSGAFADHACGVALETSLVRGRGYTLVAAAEQSAGTALSIDVYSDDAGVLPV